MARLVQGTATPSESPQGWAAGLSRAHSSRTKDAGPSGPSAAPLPSPAASGSPSSKGSTSAGNDTCPLPGAQEALWWPRQRARVILGSQGQHVTLLPNFGEVSGDYGQLLFPKSPGSRRFAVVPGCKKRLPCPLRGGWHVFHQQGMPRKEIARYHGPEAVGSQEGRHRGWEKAGAAPRDMLARDPFKKALFFKIYTLFT